MKQPTSLKEHLRNSIVKQSVIGAVAMACVLLAITYFLGRYKAADDLEETARASAKAFRSRILEGEIKTVQAQLSDVLKLEPDETALILDQRKQPIYKSINLAPVAPCQMIGTPCLSMFGKTAEIILPIYFDEEGKSLFGYLYLSRHIRLDWIFLGLISVVFILGYFAVFYGVSRVTKSTMAILADDLKAWALRLSKNPKDLASLSGTPFEELVPLRTAIQGLNKKIEEFESTAAENAKLQILRGIAHDLIGPLAQTQLYLATLEEKAKREPEYAALISSAKDSVKDVVEVAAQVKLLKELPDANQRTNLIEEAQAEIEALRTFDTIGSKNISLQFDGDKMSEVQASISKPELRRILQNLIHNSADASPMNSQIGVSVRRHGAQAIISVKDSGHGIPAEHLSKVMQPDFTLKPGTGTGLGLSIVNHIAKSRNGAVKLQSSPQGTLVEVQIPIYSDQGANHVS